MRQAGMQTIVHLIFIRSKNQIIKALEIKIYERLPKWLLSFNKLDCLYKLLVPILFQSFGDNEQIVITETQNKSKVLGDNSPR
jgi:hypothetical protein